MKAFIFTLFVAATAAIPIPDGESGPVEVVVNGVREGEALEIGHLLDINVQEVVNGDIVNTANALYPFSAQGLADSAAAQEVPDSSVAEPVFPEIVSPIELPEPAKPEEPEVVSPINLPEPAKPEVPEIPAPVELPAPAQPEVVPEEIESPSPVEPAPPQPEVAPSPVELPSPAQPEVEPEQPAPEIPEAVESLPVSGQGEIYNDGVVQIQANVPPTSLMDTVSGWFSMVVNYVTSAGVTSTQIS